MVLAYFGRRETQKDLAAEMGTIPRYGTRRRALVRAARRRGLEVSFRSGASLAYLAAWLRRGVPVLVSMRDDDNDPHYAVVIGRERGRVVYNDPWPGSGRRSLPAKEFLERWRGWQARFGRRWLMAARPRKN